MGETKESKEIKNELNEENLKAHNRDINTINSLKSEDNSLTAHYTKDRSDSPVERVKFVGLGSNDSIYSDESEDDKLPPIPDGGWGWVVVVAAFIVSACADGLAFSFGLLHEEFTNYFETTQSKTSLIGSLFIATPLLAGPIMSALVDRYGCRIMTMIAGVISTFGFILAAFSNSVEMLCLTFGFISGLAMGILYVTAVVSVAFWFDKRRNLAVSLASCGIGIGTLVYSPMTHYFLEVYDWRNTIVLLAGTLLNMCVCGALMKDPEWLEIKQKRLRKSRSRRSSSAGSVSSKSIGAESAYLDADELKDLLKSGKNPEYILATLATSIAEAEELEATTQLNADKTHKRMHSTIHLPTFVQQNEKVPSEVIERLMTNKRLYNIILQNYPDVLMRRHSEVNLNVDNNSKVLEEPAKLPMEIKAKKPKDEKDVEGKKSSHKDLQKTHSNKSNQLTRTESTKSNANVNSTKPKEKLVTKDSKVVPPQKISWLRQISSDHHYLRGMPLYRNTLMHRGAMLSIPTRYKLRASSLPDIYKNSTWSLESESDDEMLWYHRVWQTLKTTFDFKMFTEFHFLMFNLSSLILSVWFIVPYFFLKSYMTDVNIEGGEMMICIIGVASSIGIVSLGWAGDQPWINVTKTYAVCLIICGLSVAAYPVFITNYWALTVVSAVFGLSFASSYSYTPAILMDLMPMDHFTVAYGLILLSQGIGHLVGPPIGVVSAVFGLSFASSYSYTPAILMDLMPMDHFTVAYGLILLSQGIGHLVGPPIGGMLYDLTKSWDLTFYMGGAWLIVSGLFVAVIAYTKDVRMCGSAPLLKDAEEARKENEVEV